MSSYVCYNEPQRDYTASISKHDQKPIFSLIKILTYYTGRTITPSSVQIRHTDRKFIAFDRYEIFLNFIDNVILHYSLWWFFSRACVRVD